MLDEVRGMLVFAKVVENGSFAETARRLNVSRAAISSQIKFLENRLGVRLLHRSTRNLSLTEAGRSYYESCALIAEEAATAEQKVRNLTEEPTGRISVTCSANFGLKRIVPLLGDFRKLYKNVELDIVLDDDVVNLVDGGFDLAIRAGPLVNSDMIARKLCSTERLICASQDYLHQFGTPAAPEDFAIHHWVTYSRQAKYLEISKDGKSYRLKISGPIHTNNAA
ncbi:MAG: LysR substrate-binding domain-containing protein, partial [Sneathiellales bacterium]|nr:LysR substrate-binding domain-containing protein [Sneathiellales bacterium]